MARIRSCVASGLKRVGNTKEGKTIKYLGVESFQHFIKHMQGKMDVYNSNQVGGELMKWENIHIDHIKPVQAFGNEVNHYTNLQPLLADMNMRKSAIWSVEDDAFWRNNIKNNSAYNDIYMSGGVEMSKGFSNLFG